MSRLNSWLVRGLGLALAHVAVRVLLGFLVIAFPFQGTALRWGMLVVVIACALAWGIVDGRADRKVHRDTEHGSDLTILWLKAAFAGGVIAGVIAWLLDFVTAIELGGKSLIFELTSGAAWTVLLIFGPALAGISIGRRLAVRQHPSSVEHPVLLDQAKLAK